MVPIRFLIGTVALQIVGFSAMLALSNTSIHQALPLIAWCLVPYMLSKLLAFPTPWKVLNLLLPVGVYIASEIPSSFLFGILLFFIALIFLPTFWTRVPYYPTHKDLYDVVLSKLPVDKQFTFIDLGCGFGDLLMYIAKHRPLGTFHGVEIGILPFAISLVRSFTTKNVTIRLKSIWGISLAPFDFVYAFLAPPPMADLYAKCLREMPKSSLLLVNSFPVPSISANSVDNISERSTLFSYSLNQ